MAGELTVLENIRSGAADLVDIMHRYESGDGSEADLAELQHEIEVADGWNLESRIKASVTALAAPPPATSSSPSRGSPGRR